MPTVVGPRQLRAKVRWKVRCPDTRDGTTNLIEARNRELPLTTTGTLGAKKADDSEQRRVVRANPGDAGWAICQRQSSHDHRLWFADTQGDQPRAVELDRPAKCQSRVGPSHTDDATVVICAVKSRHREGRDWALGLVPSFSGERPLQDGHL